MTAGSNASHDLEPLLDRDPIVGHRGRTSPIYGRAVSCGSLPTMNTRRGVTFVIAVGVVGLITYLLTVSDGEPNAVEVVTGSGARSLPAEGTPVLAAGPGAILAMTSVDDNPRGHEVQNAVVLSLLDGTPVEIEPIPVSAPLEQVTISTAGDSFLIVGIECRPASEEDIASEYTCAPGEPTAASLRLGFDGKWSQTAPPPDVALSGLHAVVGSMAGEFITSSGTMLRYNSAEDSWEKTETGLEQVVGACQLGDTWAVTGRRNIPESTRNSLSDWPELTVVTGDGRSVDLPQTNSPSGKLLCDVSGATIAWVSWLSPSYVVDSKSGAATQLPPLPEGSDISEGATNRSGFLSVPVYSYDVPEPGSEAPLTSTSSLATIDAGATGGWDISGWDGPALPDVKAAVAVDDKVVAVVAERDGAEPTDLVRSYRIVDWE